MDNGGKMAQGTVYWLNDGLNGHSSQQTWMTTKILESKTVSWITISIRAMFRIKACLNFFGVIKDLLDDLGDSECLDLKFNHANGYFSPELLPQDKNGDTSVDSQNYEITISAETLGAATEGSEDVVVKFTKTALAKFSSPELHPVEKTANDQLQDERVDVKKRKRGLVEQADCKLLHENDGISKREEPQGDSGSSDCSEDDEPKDKSPDRKKTKLEFVVHSSEEEEAVYEFSQKNHFSIQSFAEDDDSN